VALREEVVSLTHRYRRYGLGMIHLKLRQAGWAASYKRVERLSRDAALQVRRRKRKTLAPSKHRPLQRPLAASEVLSMDFVLNRTAEGRVLKCLTIVDDTTHESVTVEVERAIPSHDMPPPENPG